eukprot:11235118-Heterocapsa_arctica.AAC.1
MAAGSSRTPRRSSPRSMLLSSRRCSKSWTWPSRSTKRGLQTSRTCANAATATRWCLSALAPLSAQFKPLVSEARVDRVNSALKDAVGQAERLR